MFTASSELLMMVVMTIISLCSLGDNSQCSFMFLQILQAEAKIPFTTDYQFKDVFVVKNIEKHEWQSPLEQMEGLFTIHYKRFGFPKFEVSLL